MASPNVLVIMTDQERYPPPYEQDALAAFRDERLTARRVLHDRGVTFHRHYVGSTACLPSRATMFTGHYPSLHGVRSTDGLAKSAHDPAMGWLDPDTVPTIGDWFRAGGYQTHYRGKWHISHADLMAPGRRRGLATNDDDGVIDQRAIAAYRRADRLEPFGFSGWIGREPHGPLKSDMGNVRDGIFAEQVVDLFAELAEADGPWLTVASFVNPHDICFGMLGWDRGMGFVPPDDSVPEVPPAPSREDSFDGRPGCHEDWLHTWPKMVFPQEADMAHRRLYHHLHVLVDDAIARVLGALRDAGLADDTIVVLTSDHGELLGSHGGMLQKWYNAFDETIRVPFVVAGPGIDRSRDGVEVPTSHLDVLPTLLGLAGIDEAGASEEVTAHHVETRPLPGRDLSGVLRDDVDPEILRSPIYFMTEDDVSRGSNQTNQLSGASWEPVRGPSRVESVVTAATTGPDGSAELWKLNHYHGPPGANGDDPGDEFWELHDLADDPEERRNVIDGRAAVAEQLRVVLESERATKRLNPSF
jgi:arylsulfatase A-like enzyme